MAQIGPLLEMCHWDNTHSLYILVVFLLSFRQLGIVFSVLFHLAATSIN